MEKYDQYERVFNHFDSNGDGRICSEELRQCVCSIGGDMTAEEAETAVALVDSDGDGLMCLEDFVKIVEGAGEEERQSDLEAAFKLYAPEGSACITPKSLKQMLDKLGQTRTHDDCKNMIARFDLNGDGVLNFDEFKIMMSCWSLLACKSLHRLRVSHSFFDHTIGLYTFFSWIEQLSIVLS